jgi:hypothetical protein
MTITFTTILGFDIYIHAYIYMLNFRLLVRSFSSLKFGALKFRERNPNNL